MLDPCGYGGVGRYRIAERRTDALEIACDSALLAKARGTCGEAARQRGETTTAPSGKPLCSACPADLRRSYTQTRRRRRAIAASPTVSSATVAGSGTSPSSAGAAAPMKS